jgi:hypothetical protein
MMMVMLGTVRPVLIVTLTATTISFNRYSVLTSDGTNIIRK